MKILVCDDDKEIVEAISIYLKQEGYNVVPAYNGKEALQLMKEKEDFLQDLKVNWICEWIGIRPRVPRKL